MKLKGKNIKRLKPNQRAKMEKTLKSMEENRKKDSRNLRDIIESKLKWAKQEKQKGINLIKTTQIQIYKLDGIILAFEDLLYPKKENK